MVTNLMVVANLVVLATVMATESMALVNPVALAKVMTESMALANPVVLAKVVVPELALAAAYEWAMVIVRWMLHLHLREVTGSQEMVSGPKYPPLNM